MGYILGALGALIVALSAALYLQTSKLTSVQTDYSAFRATTQAFAELSIAEKERAETEYTKQQGLADGKIKNTLAKLADTTKRLSALRASQDFISQPTTAAGVSDEICFDWAQFNGAQRESEDTAAAISQEGDQAQVLLDNATEWAAATWPAVLSVTSDKEIKDGKPNH